MTIILCLLSLVLINLSAVANSDLVALTSKEGKTIQVELQKSTESEVTFKMVTNKRIYTFKLDKLDEESQDKIKQWKKAGGGASVDFEIKFTSGKSTRSTDDYYYDDKRRLTLKPKVTISNKSKSAPTKTAQITILILGKPVRDRSLIHVLGKGNKTLNPIETLGDKVIQMEPIVTVYDNKDSYKYGSTYSGYVVLIHDGQKILAAKSIPTSLAPKFGGMLFALQADRKYDKNLKPMKYTRIIRRYN